MTDQEKFDWIIKKLFEMQVKQSAHAYLLETLFALVLVRQTGAFETMAEAILARFRSQPLNADAFDLPTIAISDATEQEIRKFLEHLERRLSGK